MTYEKFKTCIEACYRCASACDNCAVSCLHEDDVKMMSKCIELDMHCAEVCRTAAHLMAKSERYAKQIAVFCAQVCRDCVAECSKHQFDHCRKCAEACRLCAEECEKIAA